MTKELGQLIGPPEVIFHTSIGFAKKGCWNLATKGAVMVYKESQFDEWSKDFGIKSENPNLRRFSAVFIGVSASKLKSEHIEALKKIMQKDKNLDVRCETGFALFNHGIRSGDVIRTIKKALKNPTLKEKAQKYLDQLKNENWKISLF